MTWEGQLVTVIVAVIGITCFATLLDAITNLLQKAFETLAARCARWRANLPKSRGALAPSRQCASRDSYQFALTLGCARLRPRPTRPPCSVLALRRAGSWCSCSAHGRSHYLLLDAGCAGLLLPGAPDA